METIVNIDSIDLFNEFFNQKSLHPMVAVGDLAFAKLDLFKPINFGMYCVVFLDDDFGEMIKEGKTISYQASTLITFRPGQVVSMNLYNDIRPKGWMLAFRPELLIKTGLGRDFFMFNYFDHDINEALRLNSEERKIILSCFSNIIRELQAPNDNISGHMLRLCIGLLLSHCKRYFERQYESNSDQISDFQQKFDSILEDYLTSGLPEEKGQPTVAWCAEQFHWTPNYFGDVAKRQLHITAQEYIQQKIIERAKNLLYTADNYSITQIAESLGFAYPNHFTRLFHKCEGMSPSEYRSSHKKILRRS